MVNGKGQAVVLVGQIPQSVRGVSIVLKTYRDSKVTESGKKRVRYNRSVLARVFGQSEEQVASIINKALKDSGMPVVAEGGADIDE